MAGSTRSEVSSSIPDGSSFPSGYLNGQRGAYSSSNLDRSGSFRESMENRIMVSGPMASRNAAASAMAASVESPSVTQYMSLEPFPTNELKNVRSGELRRVLGISVEDHSFGSLQSKPLPPVSWDELKRFRGGVEEVNSRAKERAKLIEESLVNLERFRKKRQRNEIQSNEKSSNSTLLKLGSQMHQNPSDLAGQRLEEKTKNGVPNKRVRSSMAEVRASLPYSLQPEGRNTLPVRQGTMLDRDKSTLIAKDKNMLRTCNGVPIPTDDKLRGLPAGGEGWDKKMKRKRSVGTMVNRTPPDSDRELKQATQQRHNNEHRPRSADALGFRTGSSNGILGSNKMDGTSQLNGGSSRIIARNDLGNGSLSNDRRERSSGLDKEQVTAKGNNKMNICDDAQLGSQSPLTKGKASRAPRTGSGVVTNTPTFLRSSGGIDGLEQPSCLNKAQPLTGASNRKRPLPTGSSSPPVSNWGSSHRREKISRTRRANVVSPVSNFGEAQAEGFVASDVGARLSSIESSGVFNRAISNNTHLKLKSENVPSPAAPSESEESGVLETKAKEKGIGIGEFEEGTPNAAHKAATFVLPTKKNKVLPKEEIGYGVRRLGRSGRGTIQSKACSQLSKEKPGTGSLETAKPLKSGRLISDKLESRVGRPSSKKASDRKGSTRPVQIINSGSSDFAGESDDDREELLAAAKDVRNAICLTKSGPFWNLMEPIFALVSSGDFALLKHQINFAEELDRSFSNMPDADYNIMIEDAYQVVPSHISQQGSQTNVVGLNKYGGTMCSVDDPEPVKAAPGKIETERWFVRVIPLSQRLLSAIISEDGTDLMDHNSKQGDTFLQFSSDCSPYSTNSCVENERGSDLIKYGLEFDNDLGSQTNCYEDSTPCNGFASPSTTFRSPSTFISGDELLQETDGLVHMDNQDTGALCEYEQDKSNQRESIGTGLLGTSPYQCQFEQTSLDDKILMELHSIGIYPDAVPDLAEGDDDEIDKAVSELKIKLYQQVRKKKSQLCKLEKVIQERKECELRNLERLAMNRLVEVAYKKLLGGRGSHGSSHKSSASKVSKQLAMAFAKRTLARCRNYEETGQSCFCERILRDVLFSEPVYNNDEKNADGISSEIAPDMHVESHNCLLDSRVSASGVSSNIIERHGPIHKIDFNQLDPYQGLTHFSEQAFVRNDPIFNRGKNREVLLDDVVTDAASRVAPTLNSTLPNSVKCKKTDMDHMRDILTKNSAPKGSRPSLSTGRGERKTKAKPKQKIGQLSTSGNGLGRVPEAINMLSPMWESCEMANDGSAKLNPEVEVASSRNAQDLSKEMEDNIFSSLPLQGIDSIDELDVGDGLGGQGQDIGSWLNVDDDALHDNDLVGLEIPMDDLSELNMNF